MRLKQLITLAFLAGMASSAFAQDSIMWSTYLRSSTTAYGSHGSPNGFVVGIAFAPDSTGDFQDNHSLSNPQYYEDFGLAKLDLTTGAKEFSKCLGGLHDEYAHNILETRDKGALLIGSSNSQDSLVVGGHSSVDMWLIKVDSLGNQEWEHSYGGFSPDGGLHGVIQTIDGGYVVTGVCGGWGGDVTNFHGGFSDGWIIRIDAQGNLLWQKAVGGSLYDLFYGGMQTSDGDFIFCGYTNSIDGDLDTVSLHGGFDASVVKTDSSGNTLWIKTFGGPLTDVFRLVIEIDSVYIFVGYSASDSGQVFDNFGMTDGLLLVTDKNGNFLSSRNFGGSGADDVYCILKPDSFVLLGMLTNSHDSDVVGNHGGYDVCLIQLDSLYNIRHSKCFGGDMNEYGFTLSMCLLDTPRRDILVCSATNSSNSGDIATENPVGSMWIFRVKNLDTTVFIPDTTVIIDTTLVKVIQDSHFGITIFPNPTQEQCTIESKTHQSLGQIVLYNQLGIEVFRTETKESILELNTHLFPAGVYSCKITSDKGISIVRFVVVR